VKIKKKLIEVALPLEAINKASAREKSIRHGHPSTLHLWWARRPLAAARAVIFAQMVDDPSANPDLFPTERAQEKERQRLFKIIEELVQWENTTNETVLQKARDEIWQSWRRTCAENADHPRAKELFDRARLPGFHDPFAGGGTLPLEAQRLGLEAYASDLNPVAVLINKAMIEIPPKFSNRPPVNPKARVDHASGGSWKGAAGMAEDIRYYGRWMRDEAEKRIGHLYPKLKVTSELANTRPDLKQYVGHELTVTAWLWARTVKSPNPAFTDVHVPLISTFMVSTRAGREVYVEPVIEGRGYRFMVRTGKPKNLAEAKVGTKLARGANFRCVMSGSPIASDYIKAEGKAGRMGVRLMAMVAEGKRERAYVAPTAEHERVAMEAKPDWRPDVAISGSTQYIGVKPYGIERFDQLFSDRQLVGLGVFSELLQRIKNRVYEDAISAGVTDDRMYLRDGGAGASAYGEALAVFLTFALSKLLDRCCALVTWFPERDSTYHAFGRQAIPMTWDYAETNVLLEGTGSYVNAVNWEAEVVEAFQSNVQAYAVQADAQTQAIAANKVVSTDPPYYDNVPYSDLSDFFYVWMRLPLKSIYPDLFDTLAVPKAEELVAFAHRHKDGKSGAGAFFLGGMTEAMHRLAECAHPAFPVTIYYAFRQAETDTAVGTVSTGWDTFLDAAIRAGFALSGTWPVRTELGNRLRNLGANALASSIVLVCTRKVVNAPTATRREFVAALQRELPEALRHIQASNIAPVDLAQAAIGPGMAVFTRYGRVLDAAGEALKVREALALINQVLDEALSAQESDFDADSRWALAWFDEHGFSEGDYGRAEQLSKSKNTSVAGMVDAGILVAKRGKARLLKPDELPADWDPSSDSRLTAWESVHHLIRALASGEQAAAALVAKLGTHAETARELAYRLYVLCERKKRAADALAYNGLVQSWPEIVRLAKEGKSSKEPESAPQTELFEEE
jgi:putative DNA methylase